MERNGCEVLIEVILDSRKVHFSLLPLRDRELWVAATLAESLKKAALFDLHLVRVCLPDQDPSERSDDHAPTLHLNRIARDTFVSHAPELHVVIDNEGSETEDCEQPPEPDFPHISGDEDILKAGVVMVVGAEARSAKEAVIGQGMSSGFSIRGCRRGLASVFA